MNILYSISTTRDSERVHAVLVCLLVVSFQESTNGYITVWRCGINDVHTSSSKLTARGRPWNPATFGRLPPRSERERTSRPCRVPVPSLDRRQRRRAPASRATTPDTRLDPALVPKGDTAIDRAAGACPKRRGRRGVGTCVRLCRTVHAPLRDRQFSAGSKET